LQFIVLRKKSHSDAFAEHDLACVGFVKTIDDVHYSGFSGTIFGYESNFLVFVDSEGYVFEKRAFSKRF
jgi:hypothetical protein